MISPPVCPLTSQPYVLVSGKSSDIGTLAEPARATRLGAFLFFNHLLHAVYPRIISKGLQVSTSPFMKR